MVHVSPTCLCLFVSSPLSSLSFSRFFYSLSPIPSYPYHLSLPSLSALALPSPIPIPHLHTFNFTSSLLSVASLFPSLSAVRPPIATPAESPWSSGDGTGLLARQCCGLLPRPRHRVSALLGLPYLLINDAHVMVWTGP